MSRVLIINSPLFREKNPLYDEDSLPPIGLGYIATKLKNAGFDVELIDTIAENIPLVELIDIVQSKTKISWIALNIFTTNYQLVKDLVESLDIEVKYIIGGLSTKTLYPEIVKWETANEINVVFGDGENIALDIVKNAVIEQPIFSVKNRVVYQVDQTSCYYSKDISDIPLDRSFFKNEPIQHPFGFSEANIVTSRGCIYNCAFCAAARSVNKEFGIREKNVESIRSEIQHLIDIYPGLNSIRVLDDLFLKTRHTIQKAVDIFNGFDIQWRSMAHVLTFKNVDMDLIHKLKLSGCNELFIGIESGSPKILRKIRKTHDIGLIEENISKVLRAKINIKGYFIYGFPEEDEEDFKMTYRLATKLKSVAIENNAEFRTSVFQFRPYHGTELFHDIVSDYKQVEKIFQVKPNKKLSELAGRIQFNFHSGNYSNASIETLHSYIYKTTNLNSPKLFCDDK